MIEIEANISHGLRDELIPVNPLVYSPNTALAMMLRCT